MDSVYENRSPSESPQASGGSSFLRRRTLIAGAAWSVPALVLATSTPAFAASGVSLAFNQASYSTSGCSTITGATVTASGNGSVKSGVSVITSLSGGYTFSGGSTSYAGVSDGTGRISLPAINVPASGGTIAMTATANAASATSVIYGATKASNPIAIANGTTVATVGIPDGSQPSWAGFYVSPDHRILNAFNGLSFASNVAYAEEGARWPDGTWSMPYSELNGTAAILTSPSGTGSPTVTYAVGVPTGSKPIWGGFFLSPSNDIVNGFNGIVLASNVAQAGAGAVWTNGRWYLPYRDFNGESWYLDSGTPVSAAGVASGSTPVWSGLFLTSDGRVVNGFDGTVCAAAVSRVGRGGFWNNNFWYLPYIETTGKTAYIVNGGASYTTGVANGSVPLWMSFFIDPWGRLVNSDGNVLVSSGVSSGGVGSFWGDGNWYLTLAGASSTCL